MSKRVLILGANGFIGSNLSAHILKHYDWDIHALDLRDDKLEECLGNPRFHFTQGDMRAQSAWIEEQLKACDVVLPLVAIATPEAYVRDPLSVFELDFDANLDIVRLCAKYNKRIIFPSTSEVYGMSPDIPYDEETSALVTGPICKERWIYSTSKQLLDRVIYAYGQHRGLHYTLFRPFNWFGPKLDEVWGEKATSSRVATLFLSNILHGRDIVLVGGGQQKRTFLYIDDAIDALARIIDNKDGSADGRIINIGHPGNEASIAELAEMMVDIVSTYPEYRDIRNQVKIRSEAGETHYGKGYQDVPRRVPKIENAKKYLGWAPTTSTREGLEKTIAYYMARKPLEPVFKRDCA